MKSAVYQILIAFGRQIEATPNYKDEDNLGEENFGEEPGRYLGIDLAKVLSDDSSLAGHSRREPESVVEPRRTEGGTNNYPSLIRRVPLAIGYEYE